MAGKLHKAETVFVTLGENQKILVCLLIYSVLLPWTAAKVLMSHGRHRAITGASLRRTRHFERI